MIEIYANGINITSYINISSLSASIELSITDSMVFETIAMDLPLGLYEGVSCSIVDGSTTIFNGRVSDVTTKIQGVKYLQGITAQSFESVCYLRTIQASYADKTSAYIVNQLITTYLASEGITAGTIETGITIEKMENPAIPIGELLDDLAVSNGFKWWVDQNLALHFKENYTFTSITAPTNFWVDRVTGSLSGYANKIFVVYTDVYGYDYSVTVQNDAEITRMAALDGSGVYGTVVRSNVDTHDEAVVVAGSELAIKSERQETIYIQSYANILNIGDYFTYVNSALGINDSYYCDNISINFNGSMLKYMYQLNKYTSSAEKNAWINKWKKILTKDTTKNDKTLEKKTYTQPTAPSGAKEGDIWIKNDSYAMHDIQTTSTNLTLTPSGASVTIVNASSIVTISLFTAVGNEGVQKIIKNAKASTATVAIEGYGSETIDDDLAVSLAIGGKLTIVSNGTNWDIIA